MKLISKYLALIFLFAYSSAIAQEFSATVNRNTVSVGERIQITFSISTDGSNFRAPDFNNFRVISGPNMSQSVSIVNGAMSRNVSYSYTMIAEREGEFTINPATITVSGNQIKSNPITIRVLPESEAIREQRRQEDQRQRSVEEQANQLIKDNLYIKLNVTKRNVYQGEEIVAVYKLFRHQDLDLVSLNPTRNPSLNGFWSQDIETGELRWEREVINGVAFNTAVIKRVVLAPQQIGTLEIDHYEFQAQVRLPVSGQGFFRNYRTFEYTMRSDKASITVKPLPTPVPIDFNGGVGSIEMESWLDRTQVKSGEPVTLRIKLSGNGNLRLLETPILEFPPGFEVFDPKVIDNSRVTASGTTGNITFEYLIIPRNAGDFVLDPVSISYFDLAGGTYKKLQSEKFNLQVGKGDGSGSDTFISGIRKEDIQLIGKDIRFIKTSNEKLESANKPVFGSMLFSIASLLPIPLFIGFLYYRKKNKDLLMNKALYKNKKATKVARKRLAAAYKLLNQGKSAEFYEETAKALWDYISDKFNLPKSNLTKDTASEALIAGGIDENLVGAFTDLIDSCEFARYAPSSGSSDANAIYKESLELITIVEGKLR